MALPGGTGGQNDQDNQNDGGDGGGPDAAVTPTPRRRNPVSAAIRLPDGPLGRAVVRALRVIDSVHDDGRLPPVGVIPGEDITVLGAYRSVWDDMRGRFLPVEMAVYPGGGEHVEMTIAHEVGHFLDEQIFGGAGEADGSEDFGPDDRLDGGEMGAWRVAVLRSRAYKRLRDTFEGPDEIRITDGGGRTGFHPVNKEFLERELLPLREAWARSYAQYIAVRSGDPLALRQLAGMRDPADARVQYYPEQWADDDFEPIARAIDALFGARGWR